MNIEASGNNRCDNIATISKIFCSSYENYIDYTT